MAEQDDKKSELIFYQTEDGQTRLDVRLLNETVWLSLSQLAELFQRDKSVISKHIRNVFEDGELSENSVVANFATTAADGKTYQVTHFNLDVIISVGYRVKSTTGTQFRIWATQRIREYIVKGFTLDDQRLKEGKTNYFDELLARIRDIRASEKNFYQSRQKPCDDFQRYQPSNKICGTNALPKTHTPSSSRNEMPNRHSRFPRTPNFRQCIRKNRFLPRFQNTSDGL